MFGTLPERRLANALSEGDKAKFSADTFAGMWHLGCGLGLQRCLLEFTHMCEPFAQGVLDPLHEYRLQLGQITSFDSMTLQLE
jgi:hypothetical protein